MSDVVRSIAVTSDTFADEPRRVPVLARKMGFNGVQLPAFSTSLNLPDLSDSGRREFRRLYTAQQVDFSAVSIELGPKGLRPGADVDQALQRVEHALLAARGLGVAVACVDIGPLPPGPPAPPKPKATQDLAGLLILPAPQEPPAAAPAVAPADSAFIAQVDSALADLGQRADRYGITVAFRTDLSPFSALERALGAVRCPWFGIDLDPVALLRDDWDRDEIFSRLGNLIRHVRGRDAVAGENGRTRPTPIGQGSTNWPELLQQLDEAGYRGWLTIDSFEAPDRPAAAATGLAKLRAAAT